MRRRRSRRREEDEDEEEEAPRRRFPSYFAKMNTGAEGEAGWREGRERG